MELFLNKITYYTDGACSRNPGSGGYAVISLSRDWSQTMSEYIERLSLNYSYAEYFENTTNNRMELGAVIHALELAKANPQYEYEIYSDSAYVVNICNDWIWRWAAAGWVRGKNQPIENLDLIQKLYELMNFADFKFSIVKCKGHSDILENELADALASNNKVKFNKLMKENKILDNTKGDVNNGQII